MADIKGYNAVPNREVTGSRIVTLHVVFLRDKKIGCDALCGNKCLGCHLVGMKLRLWPRWTPIEANARLLSAGCFSDPGLIISPSPKHSW